MINSPEVRLHYPSERRRPYEQLRVAFRQFVGVDYPDFTLPSGQINPEWIKREQERNKRIAAGSPGQLRRNPNGQWFVTEDDSPLGWGVFKN